ncbi:hypothetical protein GCM10012287_48610 [Streptomyces daqingensis]|uniref:Integral membrane protein n=2 Tax=Streptomyces daqingensis TaxID=1472640 RepID=A0ABQ2MPA3_9ACTN|nr:hypothetical protein GCM10012287_48610 [Streptomyces daqingensis]
MVTERMVKSEVSGTPGPAAGRGRGMRAFGARLIGLLLLALALGLGYAGVVSGIQEPFSKSIAGTITVERCAEGDTRRAPQECEGVFVSDDGKTKDSDFAEVETEEPYVKGDRIDVVQIDTYSYETSLTSAVAAGLRYLFGGLCALGPALFCLIAGRWPGPRAAGALRSLPPAFSWMTFPLVGVGLLGLIVCGIVKGAT